MRLIDADALIEILTTAIRNMKGVAKFIGVEDDPEVKMEIKAYTDILNGVKEQPTIEPEVIRCKDCKKFEYHRCTRANHYVSEYDHCMSIFGAERRTDAD